jgi:hypothetical protein
MVGARRTYGRDRGRRQALGVLGTLGGRVGRGGRGGYGRGVGRGGHRRAAAAAMVLLMCAGALSGCKAGAGASDAPIHITKTTPGARPGSAGSGDGDDQGGDHGRDRGDGDGLDDAQPADPVLMASGARSARVRELQARLRQLRHFGRNPTGFYGPVTAASVRAFQGSQGMARTGRVTRRTWTALGARTHRPSHDELHPPTTRPVGTPDRRCMTGRALCLSKKSRTLAWVVDGRVRSAMDVRFGSQYQPTREGQFTVHVKSRHHVSTIYHTPMPYALFFSGGQAIHYSSDFAARGYRGASHGCVNVRDKRKIARLFGEVRTGDKVVVHK